MWLFLATCHVTWSTFQITQTLVKEEVQVESEVKPELKFEVYEWDLKEDINRHSTHLVHFVHSGTFDKKFNFSKNMLGKSI